MLLMVFPQHILCIGRIHPHNHCSEVFDKLGIVSLRCWYHPYNHRHRRHRRIGYHQSSLHPSLSMFEFNNVLNKI